MSEYKYFVFISYSSKDTDWAVWLQHEIEYYHLPASYNGKRKVRQDLRPVFRDIDELSAGNLPDQIQKALKDSMNLVVICSPDSAKSKWVNKEVKTFISLGRTKKIFPFIIKGCPRAKKGQKECYPKALRLLPEEEEILGGDVNKNGRDAAFVKIVSGMIGVGFDYLWNRYEREKAEIDNEQRERRNNLLRLQSRFIAEKAIAVSETNSKLASRLALEVLPHNNNPERPYTSEAEFALRLASSKRNGSLFEPDMNITGFSFSDDGSLLLTYSANKITVWDWYSGVNKNTINGHFGGATFFKGNSRIISFPYFFTKEGLDIWDVETGNKTGNIPSKHDTIALDVTFSRDAKYIITHCNSNIMEIMDVETLSLIKTIECNTNENITYDTISSDGKRVAFVTCKSINEINISEATVLDVNSESAPIKLIGHAGTISAIQFAEKGNVVITADSEGCIKLWNSVTGKEILPINDEDKKRITSVDISFDRRMIVSCSEDGTIKLWNTEARKEIGRKECYKDAIKKVSFSPDGQFVFFATNDIIRIWDIGEYIDKKKTLWGKQVFSPWTVCPKRNEIALSMYNSILVFNKLKSTISKTLIGHSNQICSIDYRYDGKQLVSASYDKCILVWDVITCKIVHRLLGHIGAVYKAKFSPDGRYIISLSEDQTVKLWDAESGECIRDYSSTAFGVDIAFNPNGDQFVSFDIKEKKTAIIVRDLFTGKTLHCLSFTDNKKRMSLSFSPNGKEVLFSEEGSIKKWNTVTGSVLPSAESHIGPIAALSYSFDGKEIMTVDFNGVIKIWDAKELSLVKSFYIEEINSAGLGNACYLNKRVNNIPLSSFSKFIIWDKIKCIYRYDIDYTRITSVIASYDAKRFALIVDEKLPVVRNINTLEYEKVFTGFNQPLIKINISKDCRCIAVSSIDNSISVLDYNTNTIVARIHDNKCDPYSFSLSPEGDYIAYIASNAAGIKHLIIYDTQEKKVRKVRKSQFKCDKYDISSDGSKIVIVNGKRIIVYDTRASDVKISLLNDKDASVNHVKYCSCDDSIIAIMDDRSIVKWSAITGAEIATFKNIATDIFDIEISGRYIATHSSPKSIEVWSTETGILVRQIIYRQNKYLFSKISFCSSNIIAFGWDMSYMYIIEFPHLKELITYNLNRFKSDILNEEERKKYYLD